MPRSKAAGVAGASKAVDRAAAADSATSASLVVGSPQSSARGRAALLSRQFLDRLPGPARLGLVIALSFSLDAVGRALLGRQTNDELSGIARVAESKSEIAVWAAWKVFGLALGWVCDYDGYDLAALALLSAGPATYLTSVFYGLRAATAGGYLAVDVVSAALPFALLRKLSGAHSAAPNVTNREIVVDRGIQVLTSLLAGFVYSVVLLLASRTYLPTTLVLHFEGIPTIRPAADAVLLGFDSPKTQVLSLLFGIAARTFIFTPLVTTPRTAEEEKEIAEFDPVNATLGQTAAFNLWGFTNQTKVSIKRTAVVMLCSAVNSYLQCTLGIQGVDSYGAVVYASVWVIAALVTGLSLRYVGSV
ncbi:hypothetical protein QBC34DRAFT_481365 [Podospora aff. communis PSN243]|uniref:Solute carrier family 40 protein n=1 Tax=Podospora aff. communis PSN243 TaxID=3040156 RepID=A0AAV9H6F3_9PEZI|nr:hypothetical protein QBC34DRAFT_481365 [Podospora aff. communis PSN243]